MEFFLQILFCCQPSISMPSPGIKPPSIALFPTAADRSTLTHQHCYLSPPLTPYLQYPLYHESLEQTSPHLHGFRPSLPALEEMLPHENRRSRSPTEPQRHYHRPSALQKSPEQELSDIMEHKSATTYRGQQLVNDPARLLPLYSTQRPDAVPQQQSTISPLLRRNKAHVASACVNCKKAHLACDGTTSPPLSLFCLSMNCFKFSFPQLLSCLQLAAFRECFLHVKRRLRAGAHAFGFFFFFFFFFVFLSLCFYVFICPGVGPYFGVLRRLGGSGPVSVTGSSRLQCAYLKVWARSCFQEKFPMPRRSLQWEGPSLSFGYPEPINRRSHFCFMKCIFAALIFSVDPSADLFCVANRPCRRCVSLDKQDSCVDVQHKRRGRPRLKDSTPSAGSLQSEHRRPSYLIRHVSDDSWKPQSSPSHVRESFRRERNDNQPGFSQGSQHTHRHHPYAHPTLPAPAHAMGSNRNRLSHVDIPSRSSAASSYGPYPAPNSPNYYPSQLPAPHTNQPIPAPYLRYESAVSNPAELQFSRPPTRSQPLLPPAESPPQLMRGESFSSGHRQSESGYYRQRPSPPRTGSSPPIEQRHRDQVGDPDLVKLPSLKDLGVPFR